MRIFLSHSHRDAPLAARTSTELEKNGFQVWNADRDLLPGDNWAETVAQALKESNTMVVLLTPTTMESPWVKKEIEYALGSRNYSDRLIPVVVGDPDKIPTSEIPWILHKFQWFDITDSDFDPPKVKEIADAILAHS